MIVYLIRECELYHHGIKGMKWGVRRYRNTDGSLTPAGKKRYSKLSKVGDAIKKTAKKTSEKVVERREKRQKNIERDTRFWGLLTPGIYESKKIARSQARAAVAHLINEGTNAYMLTRGRDNYRVAKGVDFVRRAAISGLTISDNIDTINTYADEIRSLVYWQKRRTGQV